MDKKAKLKVGFVKEILLIVIILIIIFRVIADTAQDVGNAAGNLSVCSGWNGTECGTGVDTPTDTYPLISFFKKKGVILLGFIAGIVIAIITALFLVGKK